MVVGRCPVSGMAEMANCGSIFSDDMIFCLMFLKAKMMSENT